MGIAFVVSAFLTTYQSYFANKVAENCKQRIFELKGAITADEDILKQDEPATES